MMATAIPVSLYTAMLVLLMCMMVYSLHVSTYTQKIFGGMVSMIMAFMLSQQIVSGNVVQITTLLTSTDTILTEKTEIIIPELAYLLLFIATIMTLITAIFFTKYIIYLYEESQKKRSGGI